MRFSTQRALTPSAAAAALLAVVAALAAAQVQRCYPCAPMAALPGRGEVVPATSTSSLDVLWRCETASGAALAVFEGELQGKETSYR